MRGRLVGLDGEEDLRDAEAAHYFFPEDWPSITQIIKDSILPCGCWSGETRFRHLKTGQPLAVFYQGFRIDDQKPAVPTISQLFVAISLHEKKPSGLRKQRRRNPHV